MVKDLIVLNIFKFLSRLFCHIGKQFNKKVMVDLKIYDVKDWETNNYNT